MIDIAQQAAIHPASTQDAMAARVPLVAIDAGQWRALAQRAIEPNGYYLPAWELAVSATARGRMDASALPAFDGSSTRLIGLMPVISLWRAWRIPLPALVSAHPYGTLCSPLIDRDAPIAAATRLLQQARKAGAHALVLNDVALDGAAMKALEQALSRDGLKPRLLSSYLRASLDATQDDETLLRDALGAKKLKELRRLRHRLEEHGPVTFEIARRPDEIGPALETFLQLEASGWKGERGTALVQHAGDAAFIRRAVPALAETAQCEIITLRAGTMPVAAGIVLRHQDRAFFFKLGIDERFARYSPGVQLTLELTRHLCADAAIASADSTASADHPMINPIWRGRFAVGDVLIPLRRHDPVVALIHGVLVGLITAHETARRLVRRLRK
ncbi:GNAT family N-acetyltransferase [Bradyrhizobium sp. WBOS7]|uniref:GNAT family N-acetyltransferase n=1 Tax=Bradyrhizobium betae TaxID=244734 RepID=A0AAE9NDC0_9BRAD|nr:MULTISPECIES: GNAT family N-acetyltransferase [Bradyrhizobium]MDD1569149.1 GNAT family N-acetyltransferase [Bradyrhizobium sp. WBOS1]UUO37956.1 GNAT family N-acetyltransferase [Bradyrhizobium sp. WBOS01]MDD1527076.1 GNAT family N-acetyltransferase [Bradyrhizobium sp. WBOS2]MDD1576268.1 GNAT family N-acetyltransferase [Bradyrhizobium sp. WBOS7]MDD1602522.1 GNAT family N-acetyltransferase [Bradyrhizobium sp. WBOS16]